MRPMHIVLALVMLTGNAFGQVILNEANAVGSAEPYTDTDVSKPYEGFDYGIVPYSGNTNPATAAVDPGNPFSDVDAALPGVQSTLPNGWDGTTGWARILNNGGDWIELVVTEDFADLRGYWLYWENDDDQDGNPAEPNEWGFVRLSNDPAWNNLRAGTIITISEDPVRDEIRDRYPEVLGDPPTSPVTHDTGHDYDLSTDTTFDPIGVGTQLSPEVDADWHKHFWVNEPLTQNSNQDTQYFLAGSNIKVDNDDWRHIIFDPNNAGPTPNGDLSTGLVQEAIGEDEFSWGLNTGAGGVSNTEIISLNADPVSGLTAADYEDIDFSTFGRPNLYNTGGIETTLTGVQDFSGQRGWLASVKTGDTDFDDDVDLDDVETNYANQTGPGNASDIPWSLGSFDGDGDSDMEDVLLLQLNFDS